MSCALGTVAEKNIHFLLNILLGLFLSLILNLILVRWDFFLGQSSTNVKPMKGVNLVILLPTFYFSIYTHYLLPLFTYYNFDQSWEFIFRKNAAMLDIVRFVSNLSNL